MAVGVKQNLPVVHFTLEVVCIDFVYLVLKLSCSAVLNSVRQGVCAVMIQLHGYWCTHVLVLEPATETPIIRSVCFKRNSTVIIYLNVIANLVPIDWRTGLPSGYYYQHTYK